MTIKIRGTDDWLVFGQDPEGHWYWVSTEVWPEWLDTCKAPEDMDPEEAGRHMVSFVRNRSERHVGWRDLMEMAEGLEDYAEIARDLAASLHVE